MSWKNSLPDSERYTYEYFFLEYVCRLCWGNNGIIELSSVNPKSIVIETTIAETIQECIGIDVSTQTFPKKICSKCLNELEILAEFKRFCQETDRKLNVILQKGSSQQKKEILAVKKEKLDEPLILKEENNEEISNCELDDYIDDLFDDLPLSSCEIEKRIIEDRPATKERKKRSTTYCNSCHMNFKSIEEISEHNIECHGIEKNGFYKCFGCEKKFQNMKKRLRHESEICKQLKRGYKCNICERFLPKRKMYERHIRDHREKKEIDLPQETFACNKCDKSYTSSDSLRDHMFVHYEGVIKKKEGKKFICDICGRVFSRNDYLYKHKLIHEGSKLQKCPHCDYRAIQKSSLTVHMRKHTGERPYACDLCPRRCITSSNLRSHRQRHFGVKAFECKLCEKKFGYKLSLDEHMSAVHERSELHTCAQCGSTYSRFRGLRRHLLAKHGKKVKKVKEDLIEVQNEGKEVAIDTGPVLQEGSRVSVVQNTDGAVYGVM